MPIPLWMGLLQDLFLKMENRPVPHDPAVFSDKKSFIKSLPIHYNHAIEGGRGGQPRLQTGAPFPLDPTRDPARDPPRDTACWVVAFDGTEEDSKYPLGWPVVLRSPSLVFCLHTFWREIVETHWETVLKVAEPTIRSNNVYLSPADEEKDWTPDQLKRIIQALFYFQNAFGMILAPNGHVSSSNLENPDFRNCCRNLQACFDTDGDDNFKYDHLISSIQPNYANKDRGWNFERANKAIGFCFPPSAETVGHFLMWINLAASFVQVAEKYGTVEFLEKKCNPSLAGLRQFTGVTASEGASDSNLLDMVFKEFS